MGFWTAARDLLVPAPPAPPEPSAAPRPRESRHDRAAALLERSAEYPPEELVRSESAFDVQIIDGIAVPGIGMSRQLNYRRGMSIPAGWRCATLLSALLGKVPWQVWRTRDDKPVDLVRPTPPLIHRPDPRPNTSRMDTMTAWVLDYLWDGDAIGIIAARDSDGYPTAALPVPTRICGVRRVTREVLPVGAVEYSIGGRIFNEWEVIHVKGPHEPSAVQGMGALEAHFTSTNLSHELLQQASEIANHGVPTGEVKVRNPDATQKDMTEYKDQWVKAFRDRTVAVTNQGTEPFQSIAWEPEKMQLIEARKFDLHQWALIFGIPLRMLGVDSSGRTYLNVEHENTELLEFTAGSHFERFEQTFSLHRPRGQVVKADISALKRSDTTSRYENHETAIGSGFLTVDEVREIEGRPPLPQPPDTTPPADPDEPDDGQQEGDADDE